MKPRPTLADYVATAVAPVLIALLVGSLMFFLIEVFYQGSYGLRLQYIMALFVVGAVGIGRISIEEGREYSVLYALPLGAATMTAALRFVEYQGPLAAVGPMFSLVLIGLIWWCTDRLTWDCTVIDEREKGSGEGLLQTAGLDADPAAGDADPQPDGVSQAVATASDPPGLWQRFVEYRRRPHAPGVWVLYFSLAALPIFGVGQFFLRGNHLASRRFAFQLLVVYMAAGLGLLLTTSFLALRRSLRQRRLEMPAEMVRGWLLFGTLTIAGVLIFCLLLPRTNAEYSVVHVPALATSPSDLVTSEWAFGNDGPEEQDASRTVSRPDSESTATGPGQPADEAESGGQGGGQSESGPASQGESSSQSSSASRSTPPPPAEGSPESQPQNQTPPTQGQQAREPDEPGSAADDSASSAPTESPESSEATRSNPAAPERESDPNSESDTDAARPPPGDRGPPPRSDRPRGESDRAQQSSEPQDDAPSRQPADTDRRSQAEDRGREEQQQQSNRSNQPRPPQNWLPKLGSWGTLLRVLYWVIAAVVVLFLLVRYWTQVMQAFREFLAALRRGFSRRSSRDNSAAASANTPEERFATFQEFSDPFVTGVAERSSADDLIRYTFAALEAWARDRGCPREPEQTPREFSTLIDDRFRQLAPDCVRLAELYSQSLYAENSVPRARLPYLKRVWEKMSRSGN